jgi:DNA-3-methyladenine glycosylase
VTAAGPRPQPAGTPFPRDLFEQDASVAARSLLGVLLVREQDGAAPERRVGRIVEVEAYGGEDDRASHARMGPTPRNAPMFGPAGRAYVYLVYGMHHCLNVVTGPEGRAAAILIRALEPIEGQDAMRAARRPGARLLRDHQLASGPGNAAAAFGIDRGHTGLDLCSPDSGLRLVLPSDGFPDDARIAAGPRVGIGYAGEPWASVPWRFRLTDSPALSRGR